MLVKNLDVLPPGFYQNHILASCDNIFYLFMQGEMNQLRDKLAIAERAARSEAQLKVN
jgi:hypothetical protein